MNKIENEISLQEIKDVNKFNKKGERVSTRSIKFISDNKEIILTLKGELAEKFTSQDRGLKAELMLSFDIKQKKINDFNEGK